VQNNQTPDLLNDVQVPYQYRDKLMAILTSNIDIFANTTADLTCTDTARMTIDTGSHPPIKMPPYRTPFSQRGIINKQVQEKLDAGIIRKLRSHRAFPVVLVRKRDGTTRFCCDFRKLNAITKKNAWPLPRINDILAKVGKAKYFTCLDLKSGYWQVKFASPEDAVKASFTTVDALYTWNVMPFGLSNAPSVFQHLMSEVRDGLDDFPCAYLDDILIYSSSLDEHLAHTQAVFDRLRQHHLKLKLSKKVNL